MQIDDSKTKATKCCCWSLTDISFVGKIQLESLGLRDHSWQVHGRGNHASRVNGRGTCCSTCGAHPVVSCPCVFFVACDRDTPCLFGIHSQDNSDLRRTEKSSAEVEQKKQFQKTIDELLVSVDQQLKPMVQVTVTFFAVKTFAECSMPVILLVLLIERFASFVCNRKWRDCLSR